MSGAEVTGTGLLLGGQPLVEGAPAERSFTTLDRKLLQVAREALRGARTDLAQVALVLGTSFGSLRSTTDFLEGTAQRGPGFGSPTAFTQSLHHASAGRLSISLGLRGLSLTVSNREISGEGALETAWRLLQDGRAPEVLVVAGDEAAPMLDAGYAAFGRRWTERESAAAVLLARDAGVAPRIHVRSVSHACEALAFPSREQLEPLLRERSAASDPDFFSLAAPTPRVETEERTLLAAFCPRARPVEESHPVPGGLARIVQALRGPAGRTLLHGVALGGGQAVTVVDRVG